MFSFALHLLFALGVILLCGSGAPVPVILLGLMGLVFIYLTLRLLAMLIRLHPDAVRQVAVMLAACSFFFGLGYMFWLNEIVRPDKELLVQETLTSFRRYDDVQDATFEKYGHCELEILAETSEGKKIRITRSNGRKQEQAMFLLAKDMTYRHVR